MRKLYRHAVWFAFSAMALAGLTLSAATSGTNVNHIELKAGSSIENMAKTITNESKTKKGISFLNSRKPAAAPKVEDKLMSRETQFKCGAKMQTWFDTKGKKVRKLNSKGIEVGETPQITFMLTHPASTDTTYNDFPTIWLIGDEDLALVFPQTENWNYDGPIDVYADEAPVPGTYHMLIFSNFENPTLPAIGGICIAKDIEITGERQEFAFDLSMANHRVTVDAKMSNGEDYPISYEEDPEYYTFAVIDFTVYDIGGQSMLTGIGDYVYLVNDLPEETLYEKYVKYQNLDENFTSTAFDMIVGPITADSIHTVTPDMYTALDMNISLTPEEKAYERCGVAMGFKVSKDNISMELANEGNRPGTPMSKFKVNYYIPESQVGNAAGDWFGAKFGSVYCNEGEEVHTKYSGNYFSTPEGLWLRNFYPVFDRETWKFDWFSPVDVYNIHPDQQSIDYYCKTMYQESKLDPWYTVDSTTGEEVIADFSSYVEMSGPFFENIRTEDPFGKFDYVKYNGQIMGFDEMMGKPLANAEFEASVTYGGQLIDGSIPYESKRVFGFSIKNVEDIIPPHITNYQIRNSDGLITNRIKPGDDGMLYLTAYDYDSSYDYTDNLTINLYLSTMDSEEWTPITETPEFVGANDGFLVKVPLKNYLTDAYKEKWAKLKVELTDASQNFSNYEMDYILCCTESTGIEEMSTILNQSEAVYYNLQGVRVDNPAQGLYIKVADGKTEKVMVK